MSTRLRLVASVAAAATLALAAPTALALTSVYDVQANSPQVQGIPASDTTAVFPTNKQNETSIALNPVDGRYLIAGSNDEQRQPACGPGPVRVDTVPSDCSFFPGVGTSGVYTSSDGGVTWTNRGLLDDQASWAGTGVISDGDPVIAYGPKPDGNGGFSYAYGARAYYSSLATILGVKGYEYIVVAYSDDNGVTWSAPVIGTTKTGSVDFNDKNWITVDASPTSPYFGRVYLTWTEFRSATATGNGSEPVMVSVSTDGGRSYGAPKQLSPAGNNGTGNGRQGSASTVGPDGTVRHGGPGVAAQADVLPLGFGQTKHLGHRADPFGGPHGLKIGAADTPSQLVFGGVTLGRAGGRLMGKAGRGATALAGIPHRPLGLGTEGIIGVVPHFNSGRERAGFKRRHHREVTPLGVDGQFAVSYTHLTLPTNREV